MTYRKPVTILIILIAIISGFSAATGIFSRGGDGPRDYESIRGETVKIYGQGLYEHMSADVAIQGIAQDVITLFAAIPLLLISLLIAGRGSIKAHYILSGILGYFLVTYLLYTAMAMYNRLFPAYFILMGLSFFAFFLCLKDLASRVSDKTFSPRAPAGFSGWFLIVNAVAIAFMWLGVVVPPLMDGSIYPVELQHYTTLIVQGFDLGLLLPLSFVCGLLLVKRKIPGFVYAPVYTVFLSLLMTALVAKITAMGLNGVNIIPAIFIIPAITLTAMISAGLMLKNIERS